MWNNDAEPILVIMIILIVLGTINVFSSSFVIATTDYENPYYFLIRHAVWLVVGFVAFVICRKVNYRRWRDWMPMLLLGMILALAAVLVVGMSVNGARRWLGVGPLSFQPAEFAKLVSLMLAAAILSVQVKAGRPASVMNLQFALIVLMAGLTELEPDMGTACIILGVPLIMAFVVGMTPAMTKGVLLAIPLGIVGLITLQPYRLNRVRIMLDPWSDAQGIGYQTVQSLSTIGSGGFWGMGLGDGVSKYEYLPEAHTDFAFAIFCQEHGYVGALMVFLLFALLIFFCVRIANRAADEFGQILAMGIMLLILGQALANLAMVGGMFAVVGVPLPFISYGGSSLLVTMIAMGMLLNICDHGRAPDYGDAASRKKEASKDKADKETASSRPQLRLVK
jgi:cell division protein FtsW